MGNAEYFIRNTLTQFLGQHFCKESTINIVDTSTSRYKLITSNYPVLDSRNLFSLEGYSIIFPITPNKLLLLVQKCDKELFKNHLSRSVDDFVINTNIATLRNILIREHGLTSQIYANTHKLEEILPSNLIPEYFKLPCNA